MGMTIVEKILASHSMTPRDMVRPGDIVRVRVDAAYMLGVEHEYLKVWDPNRIMIIASDHNLPPRTKEETANAKRSRDFAKKWGIKYWVDVGRGGNGHRVSCELGLHRPGEISLCNDSHTTMGGAFNSLGMGIGDAELANVITKGETWFICQPTVKIDVAGTLPRRVYARDILLHLGGAYPPFIERNVEYTGSVVDAMTVEDRMCMACASTEISCDFPVFKADGKTIDWIDKSSTLPGEYRAVEADEDARYDKTIALDVSNLEPQIACPNTMANVKPVSEVAKEKVKINQANVSSCDNSGLVDIAVAAEILKGEKIHPDVRLLVVPGTQKIWSEAVHLGYAKTIADANGLFCVASCGPCSGGQQSLSPGEVGIGSNTRNFKGRMGIDAMCYCSSPATAVASALYGYITDPREV